MTPENSIRCSVSIMFRMLLPNFRRSLITLLSMLVFASLAAGQASDGGSGSKSALVNKLVVKQPCHWEMSPSR